MRAQMLIDAENAPNAVYDLVWHRYISTPPETLADAIDGLERVVDHLDGTCDRAEPIVRVLGLVTLIAQRLRASAADSTLARDIRSLAASAGKLSPSSDYAIMLQSIAKGVARPRLA